MRFRLAVLFAIVTAVAVPATASASEIIDRNANDVSLKVAQNGQALVSYNARGKRWNVLAWGAVNAIAADAGPQAGRVQARLLGRLRHLQARRLEDLQERLPRRTTAPSCSGSWPAARRPTARYWALQSWQRMLPNYGLDGDAEAVRLGAAALALDAASCP